MDLQKMIAALVEREVAKIIGAELGNDASASNGDISLADAIANIDRTVGKRTMADVVDDATPRQTRKRGRGRAKVAYVINRKRGETSRQLAARIKGTELFPTAEAVLTAIVKADKPITNREIEKVTGLVNKTVQSCVYFLRHAKLIASQPISAE